MDWYYAVGNEKNGPIADGEFRALVQQGVVKPETLVWHEGMAEWQPHGGNLAAPPVLPTRATEPSVVCALCRRSVPQSESILLDDKPCCAACKPEALARIRAGMHVANAGAEEMRNRYLKHEASVKSVGMLYYLGGTLLTLVGIVSVIGGVVGTSGENAVSFATGLFLLILGVTQLRTAYGLRRLQKWTRIPVGILSGIGLLGFPIGTIINAYILHLVFSEKGKVVFSPEYHDTIAATPHIKYRSSLLVWILVAIVLMVIVFLGLAALLGNK